MHFDASSEYEVEVVVKPDKAAMISRVLSNRQQI